MVIFREQNRVDIKMTAKWNRKKEAERQRMEERRRVEHAEYVQDLRAHIAERNRKAEAERQRIEARERQEHAEFLQNVAEWNRRRKAKGQITEASRSEEREEYFQYLAEWERRRKAERQINEVTKKEERAANAQNLRADVAECDCRGPECIQTFFAKEAKQERNGDEKKMQDEEETDFLTALKTWIADWERRHGERREIPVMGADPEEDWRREEQVKEGEKGERKGEGRRGFLDRLWAMIAECKRRRENKRKEAEDKKREKDKKKIEEEQKKKEEKRIKREEMEEEKRKRKQLKTEAKISALTSNVKALKEKRERENMYRKALDERKIEESRALQRNIEALRAEWERIMEEDRKRAEERRRVQEKTREETKAMITKFQSDVEHSREEERRRLTFAEEEAREKWRRLKENASVINANKEE